MLHGLFAIQAEELIASALDRERGSVFYFVVS